MPRSAEVASPSDPIALKRREMRDPVHGIRSLKGPLAQVPMRDASPSDRPGSGDANDLELMARVRWGDVDAFGDIMDRYWERNFLYARYLLDDQDRAYDIAQEIFARLWEQRRKWEPTGSVGGWLLRATRNLVISEQRKWKVRMRWRSMMARDPDSRPRTPLQDAESEELRLAIQQAVQALSPRRREVFVLFHLQHLSYGEIGEILDIRPRTIANHLQAAVAELRDTLEPFASTPRREGKSARGSIDQGPELTS